MVDEIICSKHFADRVKKRANVFTNEQVFKFVDTVLSNGIYLKDVPKDSSLYSYMVRASTRGVKDGDAKRYAVAFGKFVLVFTTTNIAVTILYLPEYLISEVFDIVRCKYC